MSRFIPVLIVLSGFTHLVDVRNRTEFVTREWRSYAEKMASYIDATVDPCDDFYQYACGNYFKVNPKPSGRADYGVGRYTLDEIENFLHDVFMEGGSGNSDDFTAEEKARFYYQSCYRANVFKHPKSAAYLELIKSLGGWPVLHKDWHKMNFNWFEIVLVAKTYGINIFFEEYIWEDDNCLVLCGKDFGFLENLDTFRPYSKNFQTQKALALHIMKVYGVSYRAAKRVWNDIITFGRQWQSLLLQARSGDEDYKNMTIDELIEDIPEVNWKDFIVALFGFIPDTDDRKILYVNDIRFFKYFDELIRGNERAAANYAMLSLLYQLHDEISYPNYIKSYCFGKLGEHMPQVLGITYLKRRPEQNLQSKLKTMALFVKKALIEQILKATWLEDDIKTVLIEKTKGLEFHIGDLKNVENEAKISALYKSVQIVPENDFYENELAFRKFGTKRSHERLLGEYDEEESYGLDFNAYYSNPNIVITSAYMSRPLYYPEMLSDYNFATIGATIGHELGHAVDSSNRVYDTNDEIGWWTEESEANYKEREDCFVEQYSNYRLAELDHMMNGTISLNENIADNIGLRIAYFGYKKWWGKFRTSKNRLPVLNMTNDQFFFLAFAQGQCEKHGRKNLIDTVTEEHGLNKNRVIGPVSNFKEFAKHFHCKLGTPMNPKNKCVIF